MKFPYTKNPESDFFIKNPNLTRKNRGGGGRVGMKLELFFFTQNPNRKLKKNLCWLGAGGRWGCGG